MGGVPDTDAGTRPFAGARVSSEKETIEPEFRRSGVPGRGLVQMTTARQVCMTNRLEL